MGSHNTFVNTLIKLYLVKDPLLWYLDFFLSLILISRLYDLPLLHRLYRVPQEKRTKPRERVPYVKLYRYNPNTYVQS